MFSPRRRRPNLPAADRTSGRTSAPAISAEVRAVNIQGGGQSDYVGVAPTNPFGSTILGGHHLPQPLNTTSTAALAAAETASGLIERAVSSGRITAPPLARSALTGKLLATIARGMLFRGEQAVLLDVSGMEVKLRPCWHYFYNEDTLWVDVPVPNGNYHRTADINEVALPHWSTDPLHPWRGVSPLTNVTSQLAANTQGTLLRESMSATGYLMPWQVRGGAGNSPKGEGFVTTAGRTLTEQLQTKGTGGVSALVPGQGFIGRNPNQLGEQSRFGYNPPPELATIAEWACKETLQACGIAPVLFSDSVEASREAQRRFLTLTAQPVADSIAQELTRVIEADVEIDLSPARTSDELVGRARAVGSLVNAGMMLSDALIEAGLTESPGRAAPAPQPVPVDGSGRAEDG